MFLSSLPQGQSLTRCLLGWAQHESENSLVSGNPGIVFTTCRCNMTPIWVARCDDVYCTTAFNYVHVQVDTLYINELMCNCRQCSTTIFTGIFCLCVLTVIHVAWLLLVAKFCQYMYCIVGNFEGENFRKFHGFVAIHKSFLCKIWGMASFGVVKASNPQK